MNADGTMARMPQLMQIAKKAEIGKLSLSKT